MSNGPSQDDLTPRLPDAPLRWSDAVLDLNDALPVMDAPTYLVGGVVRDALMARANHDIDLVTYGSGIRIARQIANRLGGDFYKLDDERDVGRVLLDTPEGRLVIDVASTRGVDLLTDLSDRDFTVNAMAVALGSDLTHLIDPLGGEKDVRDKLIRQCSASSIAHDPVRTLRAVRQSVQLGGRIERETMLAIREQATRLNEISPERVRDEFMKLLSLRRASAALRAADALGLLRVIVPETALMHNVALPAPYVNDLWAHSLATVDQIHAVIEVISPRRTDATAAQFALGMMVMALDRYRQQMNAHIAENWADERTHISLLALAALLHSVDDVKAIDERARALRLSNAERVRLVTIVRHYRQPMQMETLTPLVLHRFWRATGAAGVDICLLSMAHFLTMYGATLRQDDWIAYVERMRQILYAYFDDYAQIVEPPILVDGEALMSQLAIPAGRLIGTLLDVIREAQVEGRVSTAEDALAVARQYLADQDVS